MDLIHRHLLSSWLRVVLSAIDDRRVDVLSVALLMRRMDALRPRLLRDVLLLRHRGRNVVVGRAQRRRAQTDSRILGVFGDLAEYDPIIVFVVENIKNVLEVGGACWFIEHISVFGDG